MDEIDKYIKENLDIEIEQITDFGPIEKIKVTLLFKGDKISESECVLPKQEE